MNKFLIALTLVFLLAIQLLCAQSTRMYIGTYTSDSKSEGVYVYDFNNKNNKAELVRTIPMSNPSFLARKGDILYAVNEDIAGKLTVYDLKNNRLLSESSTKGMHPCHIALSPIYPVALVSNYSSGSLALYSLNENGSVNRMEDMLTFNNSSINKERQSTSHVHSAFFSKDGRLAYVSDLGADLIYIFEIVKSDKEFTLNKVGEIKTKLGGGPRHLAFSKDGNTIYSILELTGEIEVFQRKKSDWNSVQIVPMYSTNFKGQQGGADIKFDKKGSILFATNRGEVNEIYSYAVMKSGLLKYISSSSVYGDSPRNLNISPSRKKVFIANQNTNNITILPTNLRSTGINISKINIPKPVCMIF